MRLLRQTPFALVFVLVLATASGCSKCGGAPKTLPPTDRFVAGNSAAVLIVPSLSALARQSSDALTTAATFPGGKDLLDVRAVIGNRLTFDPFDAASIAGAGLDPARGIALSGIDEKGTDTVLALPVGDSAKFEASVARLAKERFDATERKVDPGAPEVITWGAGAGGPVLFAYAVVEQTALVSHGPAAVAAVRAAAAIPAGGSIASTVGYQKSMKALGDGLAFQFYVPANSPALKEVPQFKDGFAAGIRGGRDRIGLAAAMLLGAREAGVRAAMAKGDSTVLLAKLDPGAFWVARGDGDPSQPADIQTVVDALTKQGIPEQAIELIKDILASLGTGSALGIGVIPPTAGSKVMLTQAPAAAVRAEFLVSLKDPEKMTSAIQRAIDMVTAQAAPPPPPKGKKAKKGAPPAPSFGKNPWRFPLPGGEVAASVADGKFALAAGPAGALEALLTRTGTVFKGPTPAADKALKTGTGGMYIDIPKLVAAAQSVPESSIAEGGQGAMMKSMVDQWAASAARITAISVGGDIVEGAARGELLIEVTPVAAAAPAPAPAPAAK